MFEGGSADICDGKVLLVSMGAECSQTREQGLPSTIAEIGPSVVRVPAEQLR